MSTDGVGGAQNLQVWSLVVLSVLVQWCVSFVLYCFSCAGVCAFYVFILFFTCFQQFCSYKLQWACLRPKR